MYSKRKAKSRYGKLYNGKNKKFWIRLSTIDDGFQSGYLSIPSYLNKENSRSITIEKCLGRARKFNSKSDVIRSMRYVNASIAFQKAEWDAGAVFHEALTMQRLKLAEDPCSENSKLTGLEADCIDVVGRRKRMYGSVIRETQTLQMKGIMKGETLEERRIRHLKSVTYGATADDRISNSFKILSERKLKFDWSSLE